MLLPVPNPTATMSISCPDPLVESSVQPPEPTINIASYKFISFDANEAARIRFLDRGNELGLKGTVLLSPEGINLFLAGPRAAIDAFLIWLRSDERFHDIDVKKSSSPTQPFKKFLVKIKPELITMKHPLVKPELGRAPSVAPATLKRWLDSGHDDDGRPVLMLDTRNGFEVDVGSFDNTIDYRIEKFSDFPKAVAEQKNALAGRTVVTFCTGGIRCEKAAIHMQGIGIEHVYQLDCGILKYFEDVGGDHYSGDCFVFDQRTALRPDLVPTPRVRCERCGIVIEAHEERSNRSTFGISCKQCNHS